VAATSTTVAGKRNKKKSWIARPKEFRRLWGYSVGFYGVWVAHVGRRLGLFEALARKPAPTAAELAARLGLDAGAVEAWCSAAVALGFLQQEKRRKSGSRGRGLGMSARMREILLETKSANYLGGQFSYLALRSLEYGALDDLFRHGKTRGMSGTFEAIEQATDWDHNAFLSAIRRRHGGASDKEKKKKSLHRMLSKGCRLLDVGCGTGTFIEKLWSLYPRSSFVGVEPDKAAARKAEAAARGMPVEVLHMRGEEMPFRNEFDLVYLGEALYAAGDKAVVVSNCHRALRKGGAIAVVEGLLPNRPSPLKEQEEDLLIMGMQLDFALQGYRFMTQKEMAALLRGAGFGRIRFEDLGGSLFLVTAWKK
jgi:SAM-dependent methyltransferase